MAWSTSVIIIPTACWSFGSFTARAMTVDRLYRHRYLHRGTHRILTPIDLVRVLRAHLAIRVRTDSS
jgi:hypothetical protein